MCLKFFKYLQCVYSDPGPSLISRDHEHHPSGPIRRRSQLEVQAQELKSYYKSLNIILVLTGCRKSPKISFSIIRWSDIFVTTLSPCTEERYPNVQKLKEDDSVKDPGCWSFLPWETRAGLHDVPAEHDADYLFECMQQKPPKQSCMSPQRREWEQSFSVLISVSLLDVQDA